MFGYPYYPSFKDDPLYLCYNSKQVSEEQAADYKKNKKTSSKEAMVRTHRNIQPKYIYVLVDYFLQNEDRVQLHGETLNILFQSNPSTKEQNFLSEMLFTYNHDKEGELEHPFLRISHVGLPVGTKNHDKHFKEYPFEIQKR